MIPDTNRTIPRQSSTRKSMLGTRDCIFSHLRPSYEQAVSDQDRSMHISPWVQVAHSSFIEGSHTTKNTASDCQDVFKAFTIPESIVSFTTKKVL
jgi:hypothetical protein